MSLPSLDHFSFQDYDNFYEPSDDTYLLLDALEMERRYFSEIVRPTLCIEIGSGSGAVLASLAKNLFEDYQYVLLLAVDINYSAAEATSRTFAANDLKLPVEVIQGDLLYSLQDRLLRKVDIMVFNPPYVPTPPEEVDMPGITSAWAGGINGRAVINRVLPLAAKVISEHGVFYLLVVLENNPIEIITIMSHYGFRGETICTRRAKNELLSVLKFTRHLDDA